MNRRNFFASLTACVVASAINIGCAVPLWRKKWRFTTEFKKEVGGQFWRCYLNQIPINLKDGGGCEGVYCCAFQGEDKKALEEIAGRVILDRQYELGESDIKGYSTSHPYAGFTEPS